jgi:hypothetical protein
LSLRGADTRMLATVGAFRVLPPDDLSSGPDGQHGSRNEWRHLAEPGLLTFETITDRHGSQHPVSLTWDDKDLPDSRSTTRPGTFAQGPLLPFTTRTWRRGLTQAPSAALTTVSFELEHTELYAKRPLDLSMSRCHWRG